MSIVKDVVESVAEHIESFNQVQHTLTNGATILEIDVEAKVVLARMDGAFKPYVTWSIYSDNGNKWNCFKGEYFFTLGDAARSYDQRRQVIY